MISNVLNPFSHVGNLMVVEQTLALNGLHETARRNADFVLQHLLMAHDTPAPLVFGDYLMGALIDRTLPVMNVLADTRGGSGQIPKAFRRLSVHMVNKLTDGDHVAVDAASHPANSAIRYRDSILVQDGFFKLKGLNDCVVRMFLSAHPVSSAHVALMQLLSAEQATYDGRTLHATPLFRASLKARRVAISEPTRLVSTRLALATHAARELADKLGFELGRQKTA